MAKSGRPPHFKLTSAPMALSARKLTGGGGYRNSPRERGYDAKWDRLSVAYRKKNPFCLFCEQKGRATLTDLVDHILPVVDFPDLKHSWKNLAPLCRHCHGRKTAMEAEARKDGRLEILVEWVKNPNSRPPHYL
jgi:hypothetical protein